MSSCWGTTALRCILRVAGGGSPSWGDSEGLCRIIQNNAPRTNSTQQLLLWVSLKRLISQPAQGADLRSCLAGVHWDLTDTHGWLLGRCPPGLWSGRVRWVASLFPPCLGVGRDVGETLAGMMDQTGISSRYWAHCSSGLRFFFVGLENPAGALLRPVWPCGVAGGVAALLGWLVCCSGRAAFPGGFLWWLWNLLVSLTVSLFG